VRYWPDASPTVLTSTADRLSLNKKVEAAFNAGGSHQSNNRF
jgi:hypothetical protein